MVSVGLSVYRSIDREEIVVVGSSETAAAITVVKGRNRRIYIVDIAILLPSLFEQEPVHVVGVSQTNQCREQVEQGPSVGVRCRFEPVRNVGCVKGLHFLPAR